MPSRRGIMAAAGMGVLCIVLLAWRPENLNYFFATLLVAALPEEWFFRAYLMPRLGDGWRANLIASCFFAGLHGLSHGWVTALLVLAPSFFYGWLYQRTRDLPLLIMVHALSNLVYVMFLGKYIAAFLADLR